MKKRVLIVEDHNLLREAWAVIINAWAPFEVVGQCSSGEAALSLALTLLPDILLTDIKLPGINGMETSVQMLRLLPNVKILAISMHAEKVYVEKMMKAGAYGYLTKGASQEELFEALKTLALGKKYISREIKDILSQDFLTGEQQRPLLSKREHEVVDKIKTGLTSYQIAEQLGVTIKTVEVHRYNILRKLKLKNSAALVNYANHYEL